MSKKAKFKRIQCNHMIHSYSIPSPYFPIPSTFPLKKYNYTSPKKPAHTHTLTYKKKVYRRNHRLEIHFFVFK